LSALQAVLKKNSQFQAVPVNILTTVIICAFRIFSKTPGLKIAANRFFPIRRLANPFYCSGETDTKRLAKPFYCKTPGLKTDANRFFKYSIL